MGKLSRHARPLRGILVLASLAMILAAPTAALAGHDKGDDRGNVLGGGGDHDDLDCPGTKTLVSVDEQVCPANGRRGVVVHERKCCMNPAGKVHCDHFPHCPHNSPS